MNNKYRLIELDSRSRKEDYLFFTENGSSISFSYNADISQTYAYIKEQKLRFFAPLLFALSRVINEIPEFCFTSVNVSEC